MSRTDSDDATDAQPTTDPLADLERRGGGDGRICYYERVPVDARRAAQSIQENAGEVVDIEPCNIDEDAADVSITTPCSGLTRALKNTGYDLHGVLMNDNIDEATVWIVPE